MSERWLGLDVGGANLKAATSDGWCMSRPFALWREPQRLAEVLSQIVEPAPASAHVAATMTGELADCFATKADGVRFIVDALQQAVGPRRLRIYLVDGRLVEPEQACETPLLAAASNWHALATFAARELRREENVYSFLLLDLGSTTCDIIPVCDSKVAATGRTDPERLGQGELVYTGVIRSPVCAVTTELIWRGQSCPVAQELFATMRDVYLTLGKLPEEPNCRDTADGRPATRTFAVDRLARMVCADRSLFEEADCAASARRARDAQASLIAAAIQRVRGRLPAGHAWVISGVGEFLLRNIIDALDPKGQVISLAKRLPSCISASAPAYAVARLAAGGRSP